MNKLSKLVKTLDKLPPVLRRTALYYTLGNAVKFAGTAGIQYEKLSNNEVILQLRNRPKVQNHIGQIHAAATALLAETATGMMVGMNLPDDKLPLLKNMHISYVKRSQGAQRAVAKLDDAAIEAFAHHDKGNLIVPVSIKDSVGTEVIEAQMCWAWIPKNRLKK